MSAPGLLWGTIWGAWEEHLELFGVIVVSQSGVQRGNNEKLEFDDPLNESAMFWGSQGFQNETKMLQNWLRREKRVGPAGNPITKMGGKISSSRHQR